MKYAKYLGGLAVFSLIVSLSLLADTNSKETRNISISDTVQVGSTHLAPGSYKVEWTGNGDNVQISILKGKKVMATSEGKIVQLPAPATYDAVVTKALDNNLRALDQIQFGNRKEALQLTQGQMAEK
jgi:hypothetical protein